VVQQRSSPRRRVPRRVFGGVCRQGQIRRDRYWYYGAKPGLFVLCDAHRLPFRDGAFDFVSMVETLEHLYDPTCALREATRVLKVEGRAYVQLVHADDPCAPNDPTHVYAFVEWSLERLLHMFFENVKVERRGGTLLALCERPKLKYFRG